MATLEIDAATNQAICGIFSSSLIENNFLFHFLFSQRENIVKKGFGAAQPNISQQTIRQINFPLPPLNEQKRIVKKLDEILPKVKDAKKRLENISEIKEKYVSSLISEKGKTAKEVLLEKYIEECRNPVGDDWKKYDLIGVDQKKGIVPLRTSKKSGFEKYKIVEKGDFVYNPMRINVGSIAIYDGEVQTITSPDYVVFKTKNNLSNYFLLTFLKSKRGLAEIDNNTHGAVRERLYFDNMCKVKINESVVRRKKEIDRIFKWFQTFENKRVELLGKLEKLEQSILAKAFRGELVEPDPNDEPAEELLKRILAEKVQMEKSKKSKKKK